MADQHVQRRLAAILATDVVGYSRLMGADEAATLAALKAHRGALIDLKIAEHQGRIVKLTGDGMLVEFPSVVNAVACAAEIQRGMGARNAGVPQERRIELRMGINLGDVIVESDDIFGDGVNVAARLESIAMPGGICVSASVREQVGNRLDIVFEDAGEQSLKNIERPIRVFRVAPANPESAVATPVAKLPGREKPSVAVLPFDNLSGDPGQQYFSDGITDDIITELSRFWSLSRHCEAVVLRLSGQSDHRAADRTGNLSVAYVVEGSVRRVGERVRDQRPPCRCRHRQPALGRSLRSGVGRHPGSAGRSSQIGRSGGERTRRGREPRSSGAPQPCRRCRPMTSCFAPRHLP